MDNRIDFKLRSDTIENLKTFSELLKKDIDTILNEALEQYFTSEQKKLLEKSLADENAMTNLGYDEFWEGIDV